MRSSRVLCAAGFAALLLAASPANARKCLDHYHTVTALGKTELVTKVEAIYFKWQPSVGAHDPQYVFWEDACNKTLKCRRVNLGENKWACRARGRPGSPD